MSRIYLATSFAGECNNLMQVDSPYFLDGASTALNTWFHVAAVLNGTTGRIYVNGVLSASSTVGTPTDSYRWNCRIGSLGSNFANAAIDEIKFFNRTLSAAEVLADYNTNGPLF
jgi:hypothetical protein